MQTYPAQALLIATGARALHPTVTHKGPPSVPSSHQHETATKLTRMQAALQSYLRAHSGITLSRAQLSQEVWGMNYYNSRTVDQTISVVRKRLGEDETIVTVFGVGYRYERARESERQSSKGLSFLEGA